MAAQWDREVDVLVAGSGAAGLAAAITAADAGLTAPIVESTGRWGGTTMLSYPGPGSTIARAVVFGYLAALHAATYSAPVTPSAANLEKEKEPLA